MKCEVITVSSYNPKPAYYRLGSFMASLARFGVVPNNLGEGEEWKGLMTKPRLYRKYLRSGKCKADVVIVCDAWDIFFQAHPDQVATLWEQNWPKKPVVLNAERNCFPYTEEFQTYCDKAALALDVTTPWKYLNGGFMVGKPADVLAVFESMGLDEIPDDYQRPDGSWFNPNDQTSFYNALLSQPVPIVLDYDTMLCMAAHGSEPDELDFTGTLISNKITGTTPLVIHANGNAKNLLAPLILTHLGLPQK